MAAVQKSRKTYKGLFKPTNPGKYIGDPKQIVYRSSWELKLMDYLDKHPDVISWASEELIIPYLSPKDGKVHRYFPDFFVEMKGKTGSVEKLVIEIKPKKETMKPNPPKRTSPKYLAEAMTYAVNAAKWEAAAAFCKKHKWKFVIMTEDNLFARKF